MIACGTGVGRCLFAANAVRLQLHALAYNLGNFLRTLATPDPIKGWSLTSLKEKLIKIGAKVVSHGRYVAFQMAEVAIPRQMFQEILRLIGTAAAAAPPRQHETPMLMRSPQTAGGARPNASENDQISPTIAVRTARGEGSRPQLASILRRSEKRKYSPQLGSHLGNPG